MPHLDLMSSCPFGEEVDSVLVIDVSTALISYRPGMRDRMIFEYEKYSATGVFSAAYVENFSFFWPFSEQEIFRYDPLHDRYEFCPIFLQYVYNYKNWTMKAGFFDTCPEMRYDVPAFEDTTIVI